MSDETKNARVEQLIVSLLPDIEPEVKRIEKSLATTQNHYGDYMVLLSTVSGGNEQMAKLIALVCIRAGANRTGIAWALYHAGFSKEAPGFG